MIAIKFIPTFLNIKNSKSGESQNITYIEVCLFSYVSNITGLICDCFLLRFNPFFWDEIDKKYASLGEPDPDSLSVLRFEEGEPSKLIVPC